MKARLNFYAEAPQLMSAVMALKKALDECGLEKGLLHLVSLRTSQINGCSYCVDMHSREAREDGESEQRVFLVSAWKESPLYTDRERAAFAWVEAVTRIADAGVPDELYERHRCINLGSVARDGKSRSHPIVDLQAPALSR